MAIRVFHCDDSEPYRRLVRELLRDEDDIEVVGDAEDGAAALDAISAQPPDVLLLDVRCEGGGPDLVPRVHAIAPATRVVVLTGMPNQAPVPGSAAVLDKAVSFERLAGTIRGVTLYS